MSEIKTELIHLTAGQTYTADDDGAYVIADHHTHADILRFIVADIGKGDALAILDMIDPITN